MSHALFKDPHPSLDISRIVNREIPRQLPCSRLVGLSPLVVVPRHVIDQSHCRSYIVPFIVVTVVLERSKVMDHRESHHQVLKEDIVVLVVDIVLDHDVGIEGLIDSPCIGTC